MFTKFVSARFLESYGKQHTVEGCPPLFTTVPARLSLAVVKQVGYDFLAGFANLTVDQERAR